MIKKIAALLTLSATCVSTAALAADEDLVKYRHHLMEVAGGHLNSAVAIIKGEVPYKQDLAYHADSLAALAPLIAPAFETEAMTDKSHALPEIWQQWGEFEQAASKLEETTAALSTAVSGGEMAAIGAALGDVGKSCKGCHDNFSEEH